MKTEQSTGTLPAARPIDQTSGQALTDSLNDMRRARSELHSRLRKRLSKEANLLISPPPQWHVKQVLQLDKAYELLRQAEFKLELLVLSFGGSV